MSAVTATPTAVDPTPQFRFDDDGYMHCESVRVKDIQQALVNGECGEAGGSPFYVYSAERIRANYDAYANAFPATGGFIGYSVKANNNLRILQTLRERGSGAVLVSGNELRLAQRAGFDMSKTVFNGNGKTVPELEMAVRAGCLVNVDSEFDALNIQRAAERVGRGTRARVMIRINPDIDPEVHPYVSTGLANSKFGIRNDRFEWFLHRIQNASHAMKLVGLHSHLGSTIKKERIFYEAFEAMMLYAEHVRSLGFDESLRYLNLGGGLGIDYERSTEASDAGIPTPARLMSNISRQLRRSGLSLIVEPGRSIVGDAGAFVSSVVGVKSGGKKNFIVVDGSMSEMIRPSLYDAHQHITAIEPSQRTPHGNDPEADEELDDMIALWSEDASRPLPRSAADYDVVGPVCESSDFLGKDRRFPFPAPHEGSGIAVMDAGAYCHTMASNYNMKVMPPEVLVDGDQWALVRKRQTFDDLMRGYEGLV